MPDEDKTFSGSFVLDLRIWWRQVHTLYREFIYVTLKSNNFIGMELALDRAKETAK